MINSQEFLDLNNLKIIWKNINDKFARIEKSDSILTLNRNDLIDGGYYDKSDVNGKYVTNANSSSVLIDIPPGVSSIMVTFSKDYDDSAPWYGGLFLDENGKLVNRFPSTSQTQIIEVKPEYKKVAFNGTIWDTIFKASFFVTDYNLWLEKEIQKTYQYIVKITDDGFGVKVMNRYYKNLDLITTISPCGANNLPQISEIAYIENPENYLNEDGFNSIGKLVKKTYSDWIGPYQIITEKEEQEGGELTWEFTGGWHSYSQGTPTARCESIKFLADNREITKNDGVVGCNSFKVIVTNFIKAMNTNTSNREVLKEIVEYHFKDNKLYVGVNGIALENLRIVTYYGMQLTNFTNNVKFIPNNTVIINNGSFNDHQCSSKCDAIIAIDDQNNSVIAKLDYIGLGNQSFKDDDKPYAFTQGNKAYYNIVNNKDLSMDQSNEFYWSGSYEFEKLEN